MEMTVEGWGPGYLPTLGILNVEHLVGAQERLRGDVEGSGSWFSEGGREALRRCASQLCLRILGRASQKDSTSVHPLVPGWPHE